MSNVHSRRRNTNAISRKSVVYDIPDDGGVLYTDDSPALNNSHRLFRRSVWHKVNSETISFKKKTMDSHNNYLKPTTLKLN